MNRPHRTADVALEARQDATRLEVSVAGERVNPGDGTQESGAGRQRVGEVDTAGSRSLLRLLVDDQRICGHREDLEEAEEGHKVAGEREPHRGTE